MGADITDESAVGIAPDNTEAGLRSGVIWNLISLGFLAFAGLLLNFAIARFYSPDALGIFNIVFAIFIFASQFGTFGIHFSILRAVSEHHGRNAGSSRSAVLTGIATIAVISTAVTLLVWAATPLIGRLYEDTAPGVDVALLSILPGLWAFSINKGLFNVVNGARHMRAFAILQSLRYIIVLASFAVFAVQGVPAQYLPAVFTLSELILMPVLGFYAYRTLGRGEDPSQEKWAVSHMLFGLKIFLSGAILELNTRVDVLMLGFFMSAEAAGIYSVAALVAEGVGQAIFAIRNNINPLITRYVVDGNINRLRSLSRKTVLLFTPFMAVLSLIAWFVFPYFVDIILGDPIYHAALPAMLTLMGAITICSGFMVYNMLFSQAGRPGLHTFYSLGILFANIILNILLIPRFGIWGAALATSGAYLASVILLWTLSRTVLGIKLVL